MCRSGLSALVWWAVLAGSATAQVGVSVSVGSGWPVWGAWSPVGPWQSPWGPGCGGPWLSGPVILPPVVIPAETMYGPLAMQRFMGMNGVGTGGARTIIIANRQVNNGAVAVRPKVRVSNAAMRAQAARFMGFGDANFDKQDYNAALERYRSAAESAADMSEPFLRQGLALVAMGRYDSAAKAMRRSLLLVGNPDRISLRLDDLYAGNPIARTAHLEALARAVEVNPQSADLLLLLGLQLFLNGDAERATPVFRRCEQLGGNHDGAITGFLPPPDAVADAGKDA